MRIFGVDPGLTTGVTIIDVIDDVVEVLYTDEILLEPVGYRAFNLLCSLVIQYRPDIMVIEDVVLHGPFNKDKFAQCKAFWQAYLATNTFLWGSHPNIPVACVSPEFRKRANLSLPVLSFIKGKHARDAFAVAVAYLYQYNKELWVKLKRGLTQIETEQSGDTQ